jgi:hypothetical protein
MRISNLRVVSCGYSRLAWVGRPALNGTAARTNYEINGLRLNGVFGGYPKSLQVIEKMERETGFEPATSSLGSWHSTTELLPLAFESDI